MLLRQVARYNYARNRNLAARLQYMLCIGSSKKMTPTRFLLIHVSNAFNALNRAAALHNIRVLCPVIAVYAINTYRHSARLFITGVKEIASAEGTTQSDPLAMALYAVSNQHLITSLQAMSHAKQCWFTGDSSGAGTISEIKQWWDGLNTLGPDIGYFPDAKKSWIITKQEKFLNIQSWMWQ